jgi:hypothetical protein
LRETGCALFPPPPSELIGTVPGQSALQWTTSTRFRSSCISHPLAFQMSPGLSPFATWPALPASDYYGDSVTSGLAPVRPSRVPSGVERIERDLGVPLIPLNEVVPRRLASRRWPPAKPNGWPPVALRCRRCSSGCAVAPPGIGIQAIQLSPSHTGLAGRHLQRLPGSPAFLACCCPLRLSPSGKPDDPGTFLRVPPDCVRDSTPRPAAHRFPASGSRTRTHAFAHGKAFGSSLKRTRPSTSCRY